MEKDEAFAMFLSDSKYFSKSTDGTFMTLEVGDTQAECIYSHVQTLCVGVCVQMIGVGLIIRQM